MVGVPHVVSPKISILQLWIKFSTRRASPVFWVHAEKHNGCTVALVLSGTGVVLAGRFVGLRVGGGVVVVAVFVAVTVEPVFDVDVSVTVVGGHSIGIALQAPP
jgi:hypothetical protein